jgi:hypothetical protein
MSTFLSKNTLIPDEPILLCGKILYLYCRRKNMYKKLMAIGLILSWDFSWGAG